MNSFRNIDIFSMSLLLSIQLFLEEENHLTKYNQKQKKAVTYNKIKENKLKNCRIHKSTNSDKK